MTPNWDHEDLKQPERKIDIAADTLAATQRLCNAQAREIEVLRTELNEVCFAVGLPAGETFLVGAMVERRHIEEMHEQGELRKQLADARAEAADLRRVLRAYGGHAYPCPAIYGSRDACMCGWHKQRDRLKLDKE